MQEHAQLKDTIKQLDCGAVRDIVCFGSDEDFPWLERLCRPYGGTHTVRPAGEPVVFQDLQFIVRVTDDYFRAIAKCCFHYLLAAAPSFRGDEAGFQDIREFIMHGGPVSNFVAQEDRTIMSLPVISHGDDTYVAVPMLFDEPWRYCHVIHVEWRPGGIEGVVQFFFGPNSRPPRYRVRISTSSPDTARGSGSHGFFYYYYYYPEGQHGRYRGQAFPLTTIDIH